jgi:hypothetical protein
MNPNKPYHAKIISRLQTYRFPTRANEWQLYYMASKDLGVAHTLARRFFWSENILWREELHQGFPGRRVTVILGGKDIIVNTENVGPYLANASEESRAVGAWKDWEWTGEESLEVVYFPELDHAQVFERPKRMKELVRIVREYGC